MEKKKSIGIVTIAKVNNYGAELQAYATQCALKKMGHDAEIIDYLYYVHPEYKKTKMSQPLEKSFVRSCKILLYNLLTRFKQRGYRKELRLRRERFKQFHSENTSFSKTYYSMNELYAASHSYDIYMSGSDQVWNPNSYTSLKPYLLSFAPRGAKRIAYASSFGVSSIPHTYKALFAENLNQFSSIGVRESKGVEIVEEITNTPVQCVLDPTLLLNKEDWSRVARNLDVFDGKYILVYELADNPYIMELAQLMSKRLNCKVIRLCKDAIRYEDDELAVNVLNAGPAEYLYAFMNAQFIVTNSFHGTAFSINFSKDFYTVISDKKNNNSRQISLLEMFGLTERLVVANTDFDTLTQSHVNYNEVNKRLEEQRVCSFNFITRAINE